MKKFRVLIFALLFAFSGLAFALPNFVLGGSFQISKAEEAQEVSISGVENEDVLASFKHVMGDSENYSKHIVLENDIDFGGEAIDTSIEVFSGTFDGNGFALKNFVLTSQNSNIGLFSNVRGGTIQNLKLEGDIVEGTSENKFVIDLSNQKDDQLYIGLLVGRGNNVTIDNCEIGTSNVTNGNENFSIVCDSQNCDSDSNKFSASTKFTFGGIAGYLSGGSNITNSLVYLQGNFETTLAGMPDARAPIQVGGLVGTMENSRLSNAAAFVNFEFASQADNVDFFVGGLVSELSNASAQYYTIINNISFANFSNLTDTKCDLVAGALIGRLSATNTADRKVSFNYYHGLQPIGRNLTSSALDLTNEQISALNSNFWEHAEWYPTSTGWDFDLVWNWEAGSRLHLQRFLTFDLSFAADINTDILDSEQCTLEGATTDGKSNKYGVEINLKIKLKPECVGYYTLKEIYVDGNPIDKRFVDEPVEEHEDDSKDVTGYTITFKVSDMTKGAYSFEFSANQFRYEVEVAAGQTNLGGVRMAGGQGQARENLNPPAITKGVSQSIEAVETGEASTFDFWELQTYDPQSNGYVKSATFDGLSIKNNNPLTFVFGQKNNSDNDIFVADLCTSGKPFKLVAHFTEDQALRIKFSGYDKSTITEVRFNGHVYDGEPIKISPKPTNVELAITVKEGYVFNVEQFITYMKTRYGGDDISLLERNYSVVEEDGQSTYRFSNLSMASIKKYLGSSKDFTIELHAKVVEKDDENNLTWLWITLGVGGGVILIAIILTIILVHRRNVKRRFEQKNGTTQKQAKVKKKKAKEPNYRDYYN